MVLERGLWKSRAGSSGEWEVTVKIMISPEFASISNGRQSWASCQEISRHRHDRAYAAVVLAGGYEESGSSGRFRVGPGNVLLHGAFEAHLDRFSAAGAQVLNLALPDPLQTGQLCRVHDPDAIARTAERDPARACEVLREQLVAVSPASRDWPDALARRLLEDPGVRLDDWAESHGLCPETISRGFGRVFGVTPAAFRLEARTRRVLVLLASGGASFAAVADAAGFADQAHMCRAVRALTGLPPGAWCRSNSFKTAGSRAV